METIEITVESIIAEAGLRNGVEAYSYGEQHIVLWLPAAEVACTRSGCVGGGHRGEPFVGQNGQWGVQQFPTQCGCGELDYVPCAIIEVTEGTTADGIREAAQELSEYTEKSDQAANASVRGQLVSDLKAALAEVLARVATGEELDEVLEDFDHETDPGVLINRYDISAWDWAPLTTPRENDWPAIIVDASDLGAEGKALADRVRKLLVISETDV